MNLATRFSNGWTIAVNSFKVLKANRQLILFPILSGFSLILILGSFTIGVFGLDGFKSENLLRPHSVDGYLLLLAYYVVNYFVVVFFNMALIHCTKKYFNGEEVKVKDGIAFSMSRIGVIFAWALFAGTIGTILRIIQENVGFLGKIITGLIGVVWGVATFFVVPVIAYENVGPLEACKRSAKLMKEKWGESLGAGFSLGFIRLGGLIIIGIVALGIGAVNPIAGIAVAILACIVLFAIMSAVQTIFICTVYNSISGDPVESYDQQFINNLFVPKK